MRRIAVFVEGQTELIIVRELLFKKFHYNVDLICQELWRDEYRHAEYDNPCPDATFHYLIVNVGNDNRVLSVIMRNEKTMIEKGYERIIGLRDMYSQEYKELTTEINTHIIEAKRQAALDYIKSNSKNPPLIFFNFAIMETEAWFLAINHLLERINPILTYEFICKNTGHDLELVDPEKTFPCPADILAEIYKLIGANYDKHRGDIEKLAKVTDIEHYDSLYDSNKCASFKPFYESLLLAS